MILSALLLLLGAVYVSSFTVDGFFRNSIRSTASLAKTGPFGTTLLAKTSNDDFADFPPPEESSEDYSGSVDWDAEWKKVVANKDQPTQRPGTDFYKSEAEIAAIKTANKASEKVLNVANQVSDTVPTWQSVKGDWKFWIGILAVISVGISLLGAAGQSSYDNDTFYI